MTRFQVTRFSYLLVIVLATLVLGTRTIRAMTHLDCGTWNVAPSPNAGTGDILYGVAPVPGTQQFWTVGTDDSSNGFYHTLIEHWDGTSWSLVSSPNVRNSDNVLSGVAVVSASDVWAVGQNGFFGGPGQTLTEHWNGSRWSIVSSPSPSQANYLNGVAAIATNDVWAVGAYVNSNQIYQTLAEHWDGSSWSIIPSPSQGEEDLLTGVTAIATNDVWAVGSYYNTSRHQVQTLIEHWDGTTWSIVSSPNVGKGDKNDNHLRGVTAVSTSDIWAVGEYNSTRRGLQTLIEHWDGTTWSLIKGANPGGSGGNPILYAVAADSASDIWAVGFYDNTNGAWLTLIEHWNGSKWRVVPSPSPGGIDFENYSVLYGVAALSANNVQAVGYYDTSDSTPSYSLIESYC